MKKSVTILLIVVCSLFAALLLFSTYKLLRITYEYKVSEKLYNGLADQVISAENPGSASESGQEVSPVNVDFGPLLAQSEDVVGWIYGPDTPINYPIVRAEDNDYYLHRYLDGSYNGGGIPFMDCQCPKDFSGANSIVYGHHMNDGSMFASLSNYREDGYYQAHPVLYLNTPTQNYRIDVFSGYVTDADSDTYTLGFSDSDAYLSYLDSMRTQSDFSADVEIAPEDRIITLSTCSYEYWDARYVVQGKLVPIG